MNVSEFRNKLYDIYSRSEAIEYIFSAIKSDYNKEIKEGGYSGTFEEYLDEYVKREEL